MLRIGLAFLVAALSAARTAGAQTASTDLQKAAERQSTVYVIDGAGIEAGRLELRVEECDGRIIAKDAFDLFSSTSKKHRFALNLPDSPVAIVVITGGFCVRSTFETEPLFPLLAGALVTSRKDGFPGPAGFATGSTPPANCGASVESTVTVPGCGELVPEIFTNLWSLVLNGYASVQIVPSGVKLRPIARPGVA